MKPMKKIYLVFARTIPPAGGELNEVKTRVSDAKTSFSAQKLSIIVFALLLFSCAEKPNNNDMAKPYIIMTLDPGHFHAALVQKKMYETVSEDVYVFAPEGPDVKNHLQIIDRYNNRDENPASWNQIVYTGDEFYEKMMDEKPGNLLVLSGNNQKKTKRILDAVSNGINVLADKPMVIAPDEFSLLEEAFSVAEEKDVLLYDIMTERYEITTMLQKELAHIPGVFGNLTKGTPEKPAITKESVHHFFKYVSGKPLKRPAWFFDVKQQGEALADVGTHLVDLVQWECFPEVILKKDDIQIFEAKRWATKMSLHEYEKVTKLNEFPGFLQETVMDDTLHVYSNGAMIYTIKGVHARVSVEWKYQAPEGAGDTHFSIMRGTKANLVIRQGEAQNYKPTLYVEAVNDRDIATELAKAVEENLQQKYAGIALEQIAGGQWKVNIPDKFKVGHEAHFGQVTEKYLSFLKQGKLPDWEVPNMIIKYYTTTEAVIASMQE